MNRVQSFFFFLFSFLKKKILPEIWFKREVCIETGISWGTTEESREREDFITVMQVRASSYIMKLPGQRKALG